jgi:hypothetical protein
MPAPTKRRLLRETAGKVAGRQIPAARFALWRKIDVPMKSD